MNKETKNKIPNKETVIAMQEDLSKAEKFSSAEEMVHKILKEGT